MNYLNCQICAPVQTIWCVNSDQPKDGGFEFVTLSAYGTSCASKFQQIRLQQRTSFQSEEKLGKKPSSSLPVEHPLHAPVLLTSQMAKLGGLSMLCQTLLGKLMLFCVVMYIGAHQQQWQTVNALSEGGDQMQCSGEACESSQLNESVNEKDHAQVKKATAKKATQDMSLREILYDSWWYLIQ